MADELEKEDLSEERGHGDGDEAVDNSLSDTLAALSLTTELDSALLSHLNLMDSYMFHMECLFQQFRMVLLCCSWVSDLRPSLIWQSQAGIRQRKEESELEH